MGETGGDLLEPMDRIDRALIGLRHLWRAPPQVADPALGSIDMSTIWIVDALARAEQPADPETAGEPARSVPAPDGPPMTIGDLARALDVAHSTASRLVARAQDSGAVQRRPAEHDTRTVAVHLTDSGRDLARTARAFRRGYLEQTTAGWTDLERASFADLLSRFTDSVQAFEP